MATQAALAQKAIANSNYDEAVTQLTSALATSNSPLWLINRSTAYQRLGKHDLALADAENAVLAATQRARREQIATAQFRRAVSLHSLKRYGDARLCLAWCRKLNEKEKGLGLWQAKITSDYETAEKEGKLDLIACSVKEMPDPVVEVGTEEKKEKKETVKEKVEAKESTPAAPAPANTPVSAPAIVQTPKDKIRHEWYQSNSKVTIVIFAKGVPKDKTDVVIEQGNLEVRFPVGGTDTYDYTVTPLFSKIDPASSEFRITPQKIEINLHKGVQGLKWSALEGTEPIPTTTSTDSPPPASTLDPKPTTAPTYPTSSRTGPKNWDTVASAALQSDKKGDDTLGDDEDGGDPMSGFFRKLYQDADPDTRRAMMKSFQESNGTSLSTNWAEVQKGTVETQPPEGVVAKKWGE